MFGVGWCIFLFVFLNMQLFHCFGEIRVVLRKTYESAVVLKRTFYSSGPEKDLLYVCAIGLLLLLLGLG